jgi:hypothetical protein
MSITAGDKIGKPLAARFIKSSKGTPGIEVSFAFEESDGSPQRLNRQFWLSEAAINYSMDTLVNVLGYSGSEATDANGVMTDPKAMNFGKEVKLVVELEAYQGEDGTTRESAKIKWVNSIGGSNYTGLTAETVKNDLGAVNFRAAFLAAKQGKPAAEPSFDSGEIPF